MHLWTYPNISLLVDRVATCKIRLHCNSFQKFLTFLTIARALGVRVADKAFDKALIAFQFKEHYKQFHIRDFNTKIPVCPIP